MSNAIKIIALAFLLTANACGAVIGTTQYWKEYNASLREANTAQHPGDESTTANIAVK